MRTDGMNGLTACDREAGEGKNLPRDKATGEAGTDGAEETTRQSIRGKAGATEKPEAKNPEYSAESGNSGAGKAGCGRIDETGKEPQDGEKIRVIRVNASRSYDVLIGAGLMKKAGVYLRGLLSPGGTKKLLLVTDDCVNTFWGDRCERSLRDAGFEVSRFVFPMGEASKNLSTLGDLLEFAAKIPLTRTDAFVALGGGVVGDLTGFAASVYLRGVPYIQIPTTLLAMVDSSVGGKTAVDLAAGKNLAGSFYQPSLVLADTDTLGRLRRGHQIRHDLRPGTALASRRQRTPVPPRRGDRCLRFGQTGRGGGGRDRPRCPPPA